MSRTRTTLSKRIRFEVFKRDGFTCQYCGRRPPDVTLHCDHVDPVVNGGENDMVNLVTSCSDCNLGKGPRLLGDVRPSPDAHMAWLQQQQEIAEVREYQLAKQAEAELYAGVLETLREVWETETGATWFPERTIRQWLIKYGPDDVEKSITTMAGKLVWAGESPEPNAMIRYMAGILRNKRNTKLGRICCTCEHSFGELSEMACRKRPAGDDECYVVHKNNSCRLWAER
jgi:hypothetical protein